jgi:hypothetical protein
MATGSDSWKGLGVPLFGDSEIKQRTAATDIVTITGASGQTGDFFVCRIDGNTEVMSVEDSGRIVAADWPVFNGTVATTAPTTGLTSGQIFFYDAANVRQFAVADAAGTLWRVAMTNN